MDKRFISAFGTAVHMRLLGRTLEPFCLKHRVILHGIESPLITGERDVLPIDLLHAVKLCAGERISELTLKDRFWMLMMSRRPLTFLKCIEAFKEHVGIERWPKFWEKETGQGTTNGGVPWVLLIVSNLISNGVPPERAWMMPEYQAIWYNAAFAISNGAKTNILTSEEEEFMEKVAGGSEVKEQAPQ
jgi:hypothetical protein